MRKLVPVLALALALSLSVAGPVHAEEIFTAVLTGSQETPPNGSTAMGLGTFILNDAETDLHFDYAYAGLSTLRAATHCHDGPAGAAGPVMRLIMADEGFLPGTLMGEMIGDWTTADPLHPQLAAFLVAELEAGNIYVNVQRAMLPGGEIRGRLVASPAAPELFSLILLGIGGALLLGYGWRGRKQAALSGLAPQPARAGGDANCPGYCRRSPARERLMPARPRGSRCGNRGPTLLGEGATRRRAASATRRTFSSRPTRRA
jgi:hypothetical protein